MVQPIAPDQKFQTADKGKDVRNISEILPAQPIFSQRLLYIILLISLTSIVISIATIIFVATTAGKLQSKSEPQEKAATYLVDPELYKSIRIVTRNEWLAQSPRGKLDDLNLPVHKVIIVHTATEECITQSACTYRVRFIQDRHSGVENYGDIGYNFLIGGDGNVYEGRGWSKVGAFLRGQNSKSIGIAFIGEYRHISPSKAQMEILDALLANGTRSGYLTPDFRLHGACQLQATESPGKLLYAELKKHPHWSDEYD